MPDATRFPVGKLPAWQLQAVLDRLPRLDPRLIVGPGLGEDAAVIDMGDRYLVAATDPVTFAADRIGWYAVHVNANDVAVMGAAPRWFFVVLLLPEHHATPALVHAIMNDIQTTCATLGVTVCGGHTEITAGLGRPIIVGQMLGDVSRAALIDKSRLSVGDEILMTRAIAIEGTALLARERAAALQGRIAAEMLGRAQDLLLDPGISVVEAAMTACATGDVHAMHDPTEGGLVAGLCELVAPAGLGLRVLGERIPVLPETQAICDVLAADPLRLLASGTLLIGASPRDSGAIAAALQQKGVAATRIGEVRPAAEGVRMELDGESRELAPPARDEVARILESGSGQHGAS